MKSPFSYGYYRMELKLLMKLVVFHFIGNIVGEAMYPTVLKMWVNKEEGAF